MSRVIVTGGAGFIGSHLVDALIAQRHRVTVVDDLSSGHAQNVPRAAKLVTGDIRSSRMKDIWRDVRPEYVFHLAAQKNVRQSVADPLFDAEVNIAGSLNMIELSRQYRVKKFIFSSSGGAIYDPAARLPTPESALPRPTTPYGIAKLTIEHYLEFYYHHHGLKSVSLRYGNVYGPRQDSHGEAGVVAIFSRKLKKSETLPINGNGRQTRDYVYVADVVAANLRALTRTQALGPINIGTGKQTSVNDLAKKLIRLTGKKSTIRHQRPIPGEQVKSALESKRAKKTLHWRATTNLEHGLKQTWDWLTTNV